jgi:hypothetical protein
MVLIREESVRILSVYRLTEARETLKWSVHIRIRAFNIYLSSRSTNMVFVLEYLDMSVLI